MCEQGGIPFPLNNLPCQCGPNWALLQGCVLSLSNQRESLAIAARNDKRQPIAFMFLMKNTFGLFSRQQPFMQLFRPDFYGYASTPTNSYLHPV